MSRVVEPSSQISSDHELSKEIFHDIANVLCPQPPVLLEIEFLGKSHILPNGCHVLVDGNSVAIPKSKLVQAFVYARRLFFDQLKPCPEGREEDLFRATAVILLMDAEHLTAANARKRVLLRNCKSQSHRDNLMRELFSVDSYLTSRLHRHTKSPTLWSHRRWLLEQCRIAGVTWEFERSLSTVLIAAERHPRNYYAWLHMRWLVLKSHGDESDVIRSLNVVKDWALKHPADTSGFSCLSFLLDHTFNKMDTIGGVSCSAVDDVLARAGSFNWTHESVWVFLRTRLAFDGSEDEISRFFQLITKYQEKGTNNNQKHDSVVQQALTWYQTNSLHTDDDSSSKT